MTHIATISIDLNIITAHNEETDTYSSFYERFPSITVAADAKQAPKALAELLEAEFKASPQRIIGELFVTWPHNTTFSIEKLKKTT